MPPLLLWCGVVPEIGLVYHSQAVRSTTIEQRHRAVDVRRTGTTLLRKKAYNSRRRDKVK